MWPVASGRNPIRRVYGVRVCKFTLLGKLYLLGYCVDEDSDTLYLLAVGGHENSYCDLEQYMKTWSQRFTVLVRKL